MFIKNTWYVAAWDHEVTTEGLFARTIIGTPILLMRKDDGELVALEDRCCHRGAPLSVGRREGNCVRCAYHGLKFGDQGQCVEAPGQERIPPQAKVRTYPVVQSHRWIWIWMGDPAKADPSLIPNTQWIDHPDWRSLDGYIHYDVNYLLICDNLLDFSHLPFVHPTTLGGGSDYAATRAKVERMDDGVRITRWAKDIDPPPFAAAVKEWQGKVDRWNIYNFTIPATLLMDSGMAPTNQGAEEGNREGGIEFRGCQAITPETANSTHYFFAHPHNFSTDKPDVTRSIHESVVKAFDEDRDIITAQQRSLALAPDFKMVAFGVDSALNQFRWIVTRRLEQEAQEEAERLAALPPQPITVTRSRT